ncbi:SPOR domain-containing protein [Aliiroseovarius crassostreae]|uniref:SPOR domain-containing protein n=1 Tax=Aliiroseovarius crassostreae TaxID=154981 RepID=UPI00220974D0|nr:SPOR domain-containing protein [Aliiroseovarius crassostreae]UWQ02454.1 SPOR domain-containing protein [Aliiroseovarius crassostreae]
MAVIAGMSATGADALSLKKGAQPAETPPASYKGNTYVDSRGCVYIRAGFGGNVTWVPRVTRNRQVVCGAAPSLGGNGGSVVATKPAPVPAPQPVTVPEKRPSQVATTRPSASVPQVKPVPVARPQVRVQRPTIPGPKLPPRIGFGPSETNPSLPQRSPAPPAWTDRFTHGKGDDGWIVSDNGQAAQAVRVNCPANVSKVSFVRLNGAKLPVRCGALQVAPVTYLVEDNTGNLTRITTLPHGSNLRAAQAALAGHSGGTAGGATVASVPTTRVLVPQGNGHAPKPYQVVRRRDLDKSALPPSTVIAPQTYVASNMPIAVPEGYTAAWSDGRLNRLRGVRSIAGDLQTAEIWTDTVPRRLKGVQLAEKQVADTSPVDRTYGKTRARAKTTPISKTRSVSAGRLPQKFVQVGRYSDAANARKVILKLQRMGLKVSSSTSGSGVKTVLAGPFKQQVKLSTALAKLRNAGFRDAFLR